MADIQIVMEVLGQKNIESATKSTINLENRIKSLSKSLEAGRISEEQYSTALKELRRQLDKNGKKWQSNKADIERYVKELREAKAATEAEKIAQERLNQERQVAATRLALQLQRERELAAEQKRLEAETQRLAARQMELRMRFQEGYAQFVRQRQAMRDLREAYRAGIVDAEQYANQLARIRSVSVGNVAGSNQMGVAIQQLGYQVGDFAVQVQSGTNMFVAFGQQATQLVGVLPLVHTQLGLSAAAAIGLSAGLGILIPIVTGFGAYFMRTSAAAKEFESTTFDINEAAKNAAQELKTYREEVALLSSEFKTLGEVGIDLQIKKLTDELKDLESRKSSIQQAALSGFGAAGGMTSAQEISEMTSAALRGQTAELNKQIQLKGQQLAQLVLERESAERVKELLGETNSLLQAGQTATLDRNRANRKAVLDKEEELSLIKATIQYGEDSVEVARQKAVSEAISLNLTEETARKYVELSLSVYEARKEAERLADVSNKIGFSSAEESAGRLVEKLGISLSLARKLAGLGFGKKEEVILDPRDPRYNKTAATMAGFAGEYGTVSPFDPSRNKDKKTKTSGGSKVSEAEKLSQQLDEYLNKALAEAKLKREQIGLSEKDARLLELRSKYIEANIPVEEQRIQKIAEAEEELRKAAEAEGRRTSMIQSFSSTIESALMSMVDGSQSVEDAFKGMLRNILLEIYRQQIVKPIATGIGDFLGSFFADGGVFQGGRVQAFATGGVVSAPTMFPMANGAGLMGEAGPEAIMPLKRGANGKLGVEMHGGGGDTINVVQNFSFSANGDESVKKIIAQAAPQIAQMTQQKIMDSRRRGGQMKSVFS